MFQHATHDAIGAVTVLGDLLQVAGECNGQVINIGPEIRVERSEGKCRRLFHLIEQIDRQRRKVIYEV